MWMNDMCEWRGLTLLGRIQIINRMAFCMRMRCWCGGNVQGVCPSIILALLISVFFSPFFTWKHLRIHRSSFQ